MDLVFSLLFVLVMLTSVLSGRHRIRCVRNEKYIVEWRVVVGRKALVIFSSLSDSYYKSGNFHGNFIFANGVKRHICDV